MGVSALSSAGTIGLGYLGMHLGIDPVSLLYAYGTGFVASFVGGVYHARQLDNPEKTDEEKTRHAYWMHGMAGFQVAPVLVSFHQFIPHALIATTAIVGGPVAASLRMPKGALLPYGPALYTGLFGLVGVGATSIIAPLTGFPAFGVLAHSVHLYAGVGLLTLYNAYDSHKMIADFESGKNDPVSHAATYSLKAVNQGINPIFPLILLYLIGTTS